MPGTHVCTCAIFLRIFRASPNSKVTFEKKCRGKQREYLESRSIVDRKLSRSKELRRSLTHV